MKKILILLLSFLLNFSATVWAAEEDVTTKTEIRTAEQTNAQVDSLQESDKVENKEVLAEKENLKTNRAIISSPQVELQIEKSLPMQETELPSCEDIKLLELAKDYITSYFNNSKNEGTLYRRYRHFILHNLDQFKEVKVANYKTAQTRPVSDMIADIKVNKGIMEENIRLCKNQSSDQYAGKMYMIIYPKEENAFQVDLVNLTPYKNQNEDIGFVFVKQSIN